MSKLSISALTAQFPNVVFTSTTFCFYPRNEDATYMGSAPAGRKEFGDYIRMTNRHGGSDTVLANDTARILELAAWHNAR
ncbi:MAG: hypothetical protein EOM21_15905 [Gammaproteobacteria bacterium]|nr:hypothetical protein [Gammaproteobacteria bacterium]